MAGCWLANGWPTAETLGHVRATYQATYYLLTTYLLHVPGYLLLTTYRPRAHANVTTLFTPRLLTPRAPDHWLYTRTGCTPAASPLCLFTPCLFTPRCAGSGCTTWTRPSPHGCGGQRPPPTPSDLPAAAWRAACTSSAALHTRPFTPRPSHSPPFTLPTLHTSQVRLQRPRVGGRPRGE